MLIARLGGALDHAGNQQRADSLPSPGRQHRPLHMDLVAPVGRAVRQDREVADQLTAGVEGADEVLPDLDLGVGHLLGEVGGGVVLTGAIDLLDHSQQVGPGRDVAADQWAQADGHAHSVSGSWHYSTFDVAPASSTDRLATRDQRDERKALVLPEPGELCRSGPEPVHPSAPSQVNVFQVSSRSLSSLVIGQAPSDQFEMTV